MLYLNPPYFVIDGVSIFPDHADPLQFYFLPMAPHLSTTKDPTTGADAPTLQLIEYEGAAGTGGFINFDVNLGISDDALASVAQQLQQKARLANQPRLSPVTFVDGSVRLLILGSGTPDSAGAAATSTTTAPAASAATAGPQFVIKIQGASKPSLFGDNQATFSVQLDQYGATVLEQALLKGEIAPVAVIYALEFVALRPAFKVSLHVDWDRVQSHVDDQFHAGVLFFATDIEKAVDKLIEDRVITLDVDTFVTDTDGGKDVASDRDRAVAEVYDMIKNTFFESSLPPPQDKKPDDWDKAKDAFNTVSEMALTGGAASAACFSKKSVDLTRIDKKCLDVNISERTSVQRTIYPQGHLSSLLGAVLKNGLPPDRFIVKVDLDNPWFQRRRVSLTSHANFDGDLIDSIDVDLAYNGIVNSVSLTKANPTSAVEWSSVLADGKMVRPVAYSYTVNFGAVDASQRPTRLKSAQFTEIGDVLGIQPSATPSPAYATTVIPVRADAAPWDRYPSIEIALRYDDPANNIRLRYSQVLTAQAPEFLWSLFLCDLSKREVFYQLTYTLASGSTTVLPWASTTDGKIDVRDPFPNKLQLTIVPAVDWTSVSTVLIHVSYPSKEAPVAQQNFIFTSKNGDPQTLIADRQDAAQNTFYYEAKILGAHGQVWTVPASVTKDNYLVLQNGMPGQQIVFVRSEAVDFATVGVAEVDVQLRYVDAKSQLNASALVKLASQTDVQSFPYQFLDASISPEYRVDVTLENRQVRSIDWSPVAGNAVTVKLSDLA